MSFDADIHLLIDKLLKNNPIFGKNGFYYKNSLEFEQNGVTDHFINMFYIRPLPKGNLKYLVKYDGNMCTVKGTFRLVLQLSKTVNNPIKAVMSQIEHNVLGYNDSSDEVYKAEYGKEKDFDSVDLYLVDFEVIQETISSTCNPKFITIC